MKDMMTYMTDDPDLQEVVRAMEGSNGPNQKRIAEVGLAWLALLLRKNNDYGGSAWEVPVLLPDMDVGTAILARMSDKIARLRTLGVLGYRSVNDETFDDTIGDLGAYCLLYLARPTDTVSVAESPCACPDDDMF